MGPGMKQDWIWMPHPGHFICGYKCQFKLCTYVNGYIVSTVGEMPSMFKPKQFESIGYNRIYETMVFKAEAQDEICCPYKIIVSEELDMRGYNTAADATKGHMELCEEWDAK